MNKHYCNEWKSDKVIDIDIEKIEWERESLGKFESTYIYIKKHRRRKASVNVTHLNYVVFQTKKKNF